MAKTEQQLIDKIIEIGAECWERGRRETLEMLIEAFEAIKDQHENAWSPEDISSLLKGFLNRSQSDSVP